MENIFHFNLKEEDNKKQNPFFSFKRKTNMEMINILFLQIKLLCERLLNKKFNKSQNSSLGF
jgi:hypothetical protein